MHTKLRLNESGHSNRIRLTPWQKQFLDECLVGLNATQAAIRAGYSARTANEQAARLLANASVASAIQAARQARSERVRITQDDVIRGLHREATWTGEGSTHAARVSAWGLIAKHLGMLVDRRQLLGQDGQPAGPQLFTLSITGHCFESESGQAISPKSTVNSLTGS